MVTNGKGWRWSFLPRARAFHLYAMAALKGALYAELYAGYRVGVSLLRLEGGTLRPVPGWPPTRPSRSPTGPGRG